MPTDFGSRLRQARERRGLSLRQIATVTKINLSALEGLEANNPSKLPGGIFSRAFVKAYAQEVGLDPDATVREFLDTFAQDVEPLKAVVVPPPVSEPPSRMLGPIVAVVVLVVAAIVGLRFIGWPASTSQADQSTTTASPAATVPLPLTPPAPEPPPPAGADEVPFTGGPAPSDGAASSATARPVEPTVAVATAPAAVDDGLMRLSFRAQGGPCWVQVVADGKMELSREISAGETETRAARDAFDIKVGDAGRCTYTLNDRPGRPFGPAGKVVRVRIDRQSLATFFQGS